METHQIADTQACELAWHSPPDDPATPYLNRHVDLSELMSQTLGHMVRHDRSIFGE
jgi:hypothetical protein